MICDITAAAPAAAAVEERLQHAYHRLRSSLDLIPPLSELTSSQLRHRAEESSRLAVVAAAFKAKPPPARLEVVHTDLVDGRVMRRPSMTQAMRHNVEP